MIYKYIRIIYVFIYMCFVYILLPIRPYTAVDTTMIAQRPRLPSIMIANVYVKLGIRPKTTEIF